MAFALRESSVVLQEPVVSAGDAVSKRNRRAPAERAQFGNIEKYSRRGVPVPHTTNSCAPLCFASCAFRKSAASACDVSRSKLSFGPKRFVGIAEIKFAPYSRA